MNFVAAMLILGRLPQSYTGSYSLSPESENDTQNLVKLNNLDILDPNSDYCLHAEYDVYFFLLQVSDKGSKLAMNSMWQSGQSQIKLRAFQLDKILRWLVPALHTHFYDIQLTPEVSHFRLYLSSLYTSPLCLSSSQCRCWWPSGLSRSIRIRCLLS